MNNTEEQKREAKISGGLLPRHSLAYDLMSWKVYPRFGRGGATARVPHAFGERGCKAGRGYAQI